MSQSDEKELIGRIQAGDASAWETLISEYEGRLIAFAAGRLSDRSQAEDVVQEAFLGFLISLPHYDSATPLESYLFSITAHKLTDVLRKQGRRPLLISSGTEGEGDRFPDRRNRAASSLARNRELEKQEERALRDCLQTWIRQWQVQGDWERLKCTELLLVKGWPNKEVAIKLGLSEQAVANHKQFLLGKLKSSQAAVPSSSSGRADIHHNPA